MKKKKFNIDLEREKEVLAIKASNEMLEQAKKTVLEHFNGNQEKCGSILEEIDTAMNQNIERAEQSFGVKQGEMDSMRYHDVDPEEEAKYYERLKNLGKSDELLHMKDVSEQLKTYEKGGRAVASPSKKKKSKLDTLTDKLKKLGESVVKNNGKSSQDKENHIVIPETEVKDTESKKEEKTRTCENISIRKDTYAYSDFDPRDVPSYVQYDMIPLPSKGECYPHKKSMIPVAYMTAADENLITSRNLYNSGSMIDLILERKILDKSIRVSDLCNGDRDAIAIWLRATAYGPEYPIIAMHDGVEIESSVDLSNIEYLEFNLKGDENGWFDYTTGNGDTIKFKILTSKEENELLKGNSEISEVLNRSSIIDSMNSAYGYAEQCTGDGVGDILETINVIKEWASGTDNEFEKSKEKISVTYITDRMFKQTMSVNGNCDREYIRGYIENMRAGEAFSYRDYINKHTPGVNMNITVQIPESQGGGSIETFLSIGETVFINV